MVNDLPDKIIEFKNVNFQYPEAKTKAIDNLSFSVDRGSWFCILGHNGSGKSTVTKLINGLLLSNTGSEIIVDGQTVNEKTAWDVRDKVGIVFQNPDNQFVGATVADDVAFGLENRGVARSEMLKTVDRVINDVGMSAYKNSEPSNLSGGQKQRVAIAGILAIEPQILILDEATSMLDPQGRKNIIDLVRKMKAEKNLTIISITHNIDEALFADQILVLNDGKKILEGSPVQVFKQRNLLQNMGLDLPFVYDLREKLEEHGIAIPTEINTQEKLISYLCQLNSKM